jgi:hypothetical protein
MTHDRSLIAVPLFIDVMDVMRSMKCSRSRAYEHMRAALRRQPGERGQSRVPLYVWERYVRERFDPEAGGAAADRVAKTRHGEVARPPLRMTRPRTKPREVTAAEGAVVLQNPRVGEDPSAC